MKTPFDLPPADRARRLLEAHLNPYQVSCLHRQGWFIEKTPVGNVYAFHLSLEAGAWITSPGGSDWCIGIRDNIPYADQLLALLLFLRADERSFRAIANTNHVWPKPRRRTTSNG